VSSANLDHVRSILAPFGRGDFSSVEWAHPEIAFVVADGPEPGSWTGISAWVVWRDDFLTAWEGYRIKVDEYRELDDERVLVLARTGGGRGRTSGLELGPGQGGGGGFLFHVRDGKVTRLVIYLEREHALADLGLAPEGDAATRLD
jgi:ketosteroid isomerase-like protein